MPLLQSTIVNKYLATLDRNKIDDAYQRFCAYFHDAERQKNIMQSKEEQFQEGFLRELFVNILGYTLNPDPGFDLITEKKDTKDAKKADGAILVSGEVVAVIELKDHKTPDLDKVERQAFGYKNQHKKATYVITSNFHLLRFYIDNAVEYLEWNLFKLTREEFAMLWLCLSHECLMSGLPKTLKNESVSNEEQITNQLYKDYITFKRELFADILSRNTTEDGERSAPEWKILLFKKTQKLLDRLLFIFFAEDGGLLPPNATVGIINDWQKLKDLDAYTPLYNRLRQYFSYLDQGKPEKGIFAYNGGLFKPDEVLDALLIDDEILATHTRKLSEYDFCSDVDVNILGHIFENSLSEIEEVTAQLEQGEAPAVSKRKKDGVFYTPQYITKYIVENTVGRLCAEKKAAIGINDIDYFSDEKLSTKRKQQMMATITEYREWLLQLTICDPACGSGAFLNAALRFLMDEHHTLDEMEANITGSTIVFENIENSILENNLYGVDINEESVEIARLALWLRTAKPQRKLSSLNNNIKCGNSLISDPTVAGDKAFDWEKEFPQVFAKGGFDVLVGNPPYLRVQGMRENHEAEAHYYESFYKSATERFDYYVLFMERGFSLIKSSGIMSYILPHKFINASFGVGIRSFIYENKALCSLLHFGAEQVFHSASVYTCIISLSHDNRSFQFAQVKPNDITNNSLSMSEIPFDSISDAANWKLHDGTTGNLLEKLNTCKLRLKDIYHSCSQGVVSMGDDIYMMKGIIDGIYFKGYSVQKKEEVIIEAEIMRPVLKGEDVKRYATPVNQYYLIYPHYQKDGKTLVYSEEELQTKYPLCYKYLLPYKEQLIEKKIRYKTNPTYWYSLHRAREISMFEKKKIITPEISLGCNMTIDENLLYHNTKIYTIDLKKEYSSSIYAYLAVLNSQIMWYYLVHTGYTLRGGYFCFKTNYIDNFPIPDISKNEPFLAEKAEQMLTLTADLQKLRSRFHRRMTENLEDLKKITTALETFDHLSFEEFNKELKKQKVKLSLTQQDEWEEYFAQNKQRCADIEAQIAQTDKEIDRLVYQLYGLTEEEIVVVEGSDK